MELPVKECRSSLPGGYWRHQSITGDTINSPPNQKTLNELGASTHMQHSLPSKQMHSETCVIASVSAHPSFTV